MKNSSPRCSLCCCSPPSPPRPRHPADEPDTLPPGSTRFRAQYHLDETNFAVSYYNTVTGEEYNWNETAMLTAGSTFQAPAQPLLLRAAKRRRNLRRHGPAEGGATLDRCHYLSLVESNNELSIAMLYRIGDFRVYKEACAASSR